MNKKYLVEQVMATTDWSREKASDAVDVVLEVIRDSLARQQDVRLVGFGTFSVAHRRQRRGRNPRTGAEILIRASNIPKFKAGKALKDAVNLDTHGSGGGRGT